MALSENFLQELKMKTDIYDVISTYVTLKKRGNTYVGLCPFHNEKTPSFTVYSDTQSFYCFGCGAGGDAVSFVKKIENLDYIDAVKSLTQRAGMQMPDEGTYDDSIAKDRRKILEINRATAKFYHSYMMSEEGKKGLDYFLNRGLSIKTIGHFGLGYAPDSWDELLKHLKSKGYSVSDMLKANVIKEVKKFDIDNENRGNKAKGYYDNFRNRVITPIIDVRGNVVAFGGRVLDDSKPKYINTSDTLVYKKTNELFAMNFAKDSGSDSLILCEGYMDVIAMHQAGFTNAIAGCGTALTEMQVKLISRYANEVILAYDTDEAGQKALHKAIRLFRNTDVKTKIPALIGGKDPDEIIKTYGKEKFKGMLEGASNEIEFQILELKEKYNLNRTQGKIDFFNDVIKILANTSPIEQDLYVSRLADELQIDKQKINIQLEEYIKQNKKKNRNREFKTIVDNSIRDINKQSYASNESIRKIKAEDRFIALLIKHPNCLKLCNDFDSNHLTEGFITKVYSIICDRISNGYNVDMTSFSYELTEMELSRLSGIIARSVDSFNPQNEFIDCINVINEEYGKKHIEKLSYLQNDDDFRNMFKQNSDNT